MSIRIMPHAPMGSQGKTLLQPERAHEAFQVPCGPARTLAPLMRPAERLLSVRHICHQQKVGPGHAVLRPPSRWSIKGSEAEFQNVRARPAEATRSDSAMALRVFSVLGEARCSTTQSNSSSSKGR